MDCNSSGGITSFFGMPLESFFIYEKVIRYVLIITNFLLRKVIKMLILRKINNNVALAKDNEERKVVVFGKGIGFPKTPYELKDMSKVDNVFYDVKNDYLDLLNEVPQEYFEVAILIKEEADNQLDYELNPNVFFTLADHIYFANENLKNNITIKNPLLFHVEYLYPVEMSIGYQALEYLNSNGIKLPESEAASIAIHLVNAASSKDMNFDDTIQEIKVLDKITQLVEEKLRIVIDKKSYSYYRFVSHVRYLLINTRAKRKSSLDNFIDMNQLKNNYYKEYICAEEIINYINISINESFGEDEVLFLVLHIHRLTYDVKDKK